MTAAQTERLKIGDRVMWHFDSTDLGTIIDTGYIGITVTWDNGQTGTMHRNDCGLIEVAG